MNYSFQITEEDVIQTVLNKFLLDIDYNQASKILAKLDHDKVADKALDADDIDEQTEFAYTEIAKQISEGNLFQDVVG